jgi:calcineurin-like phosphoesterase family protein
MCARPFTDVEHMNKALIENWNAVISDNDEIYILGDFLFKGNGAQANEILRKLRGKKYLIKGNHEKYLNSQDFDASAFQWIKDYHVLDYKDARYVLFHYPIYEWAHYFRKSAHLYGHVHKRINPAPNIQSDFGIFNRRAINVSVDVNDFRPVSAEEIYVRAFEGNDGNIN